MAYIGFGKINKDIIPLILSCVFCLLNRLVNCVKDVKLFTNVILTNIFVALAHSLMIIPYIIYKIATKKCRNCNKNKEKFGFSNAPTLKTVDETSKSKYIYNNNDITKGKWKYLFIILTGLIFFVNNYMFIYTIQVKSNTWTIYIVFASLFYYLFFKSKLFRHHYLSICLILIIGVIIDVVVKSYKEDTSKKEIILKFILSIIRVILLAFNFVLIKYTMEKKYVSPYILGTFDGLINLVLFIIFAVLDHKYFHLYPDGIKYLDYFQNLDTKEILVLLGVISTQLGLYSTIMLVDKNDSPCHIFIIFTFGQFGYYFYQNIKDVGKLIGIIICLIFMLFFSLVFNEIIELRFLGLDYNTKRNIAERAELEVIGAMVTNSDADADAKSEDSIELMDKPGENEED